MGSHDYYKGQCKNCRADCDDNFCSWGCQEEWEAGLEDHLDGLREERLLEEHLQEDQ